MLLRNDRHQKEYSLKQRIPSIYIYRRSSNEGLSIRNPSVNTIRESADRRFSVLFRMICYTSWGYASFTRGKRHYQSHLLISYLASQPWMSRSISYPFIHWDRLLLSVMSQASKGHLPARADEGNHVHLCLSIQTVPVTCEWAWRTA